MNNEPKKELSVKIMLHTYILKVCVSFENVLKKVENIYSFLLK